MLVVLTGTVIQRVRHAFPRSAALVENSGALAIGTMAMAGLGFVYWWLAARLFPPEVIGHAAALLSVMGLIGMLGEAGLGPLLMGELARHRDKGSGLVTGAASVGLALAVGLGLSFVFVSPLISSTGLINSWFDAVLFVLGCGLTGLGMVIDSALVANLSSTSRMIRQILFSMFKLVLIAAAWASGHVSNAAILLTWVAGLLASWVAVDLLTRGAVRRLTGPPDFRLLHALRHKVYDHYALDVAAQASGIIMPYVVLIVLSPTINAAFVSLWMLISVASTIPAIMATVLFPVARAIPEQSARAVHLSLTASMVFSLTSGGFIFAYSEEILAAFNPAYPEIAGSSLRFLGFSLVGTTLKFHACALARVSDAMRKASLWFGCGGLLELCLALIGAKLDGLQGLALGWTLAVSIQGACAAIALAFHGEPGASAAAAHERPAASAAQTWRNRTANPPRP